MSLDKNLVKLGRFLLATRDVTDRSKLILYHCRSRALFPIWRHESWIAADDTAAMLYAQAKAHAKTLPAAESPHQYKACTFLRGVTRSYKESPSNIVLSVSFSVAEESESSTDALVAQLVQNNQEMNRQNIPVAPNNRSQP